MVAAALAAAGPVSAGTPEFDPGTQRETQLLSQTYDGTWPDGPSQDPAFSQDRQYASVAAFDSDANNLVPGDTNGTTDVFAAYRKQPYTLAGEPWQIDSTELVSRGLGGQPADGPSYLPDVGGDQIHTPRCIAFVSAADNLVPGDTNGKPDVFVYDLYTQQIQRVSVGSGGVQSDGTLGDRGNDAGLQGLTFLASADSHGVAGNGDSAELSFARSPDGCGGLKTCADSGAEALYFTSSAQNLSPNDKDPGADIYTRRFVRDDRLDPVAVRTRLITLGADGESHHPATNNSGRYVAFTTSADNMFPGDTNASLDVVRVDTATTPFRVEDVSRSRAVGEEGNGDSDEPSISRPGSPVFFASDASDLQPTPPTRPGVYADENRSRDVFFWNSSHKVWLVGRDSKNRIVNQPSRYASRVARRRVPPVVAGPTDHPAASAYGNYVLFESTYPLMDLGIAGPVLPAADLVPGPAAQLSQTQASFHQVYLRYIGPR